jgi:hypothetical protein
VATGSEVFQQRKARYAQTHAAHEAYREKKAQEAAEQDARRRSLPRAPRAKARMADVPEARPQNPWADMTERQLLPGDELGDEPERR